MIINRNFEILAIFVIISTIVAFPAGATGNVSISSTPSGADIYIDGTHEGKTPFTVGQILPGSHTVKLTSDTYDDWSKDINVIDGDVVTVDATLLITSISISSSPSGADIYIDGSYKGKTPFTLNKILPGIHTVKVSLDEYDEWTTNVNVVSGDTSSISTTLNKTSVAISSAPSGADIYIDGAYKGKTPFTINRVLPGSHTVKLSLDEYDEWMTNVNVANGDTITLSPTLNKTSVSVSSIPSGADIYIDGTYKGKTPFTVNKITSGSHTVKLTLDTYDDWSTTINTASGEDMQVNATLLATTISVSSAPSGADIYIDGSNKGKTPLTINRVLPGSHTIKLSLDEYDEWTTDVNIISGNTTSISTTLVKTTVSVSSEPSGAYIYIDGSNKGNTPLTINRVLPGSHTIKLTLDKYDEWTTNINVVTGEDAPVNATLVVTTPSPTATPIVPDATTAPIQTDLPTPVITTATPVDTEQSHISTKDGPPYISVGTDIVDLNNNNQLDEGEKLNITYGASDGSVKSIKLFINGNMVDMQNKEGTYTKTTDPLPMGDYSITVEATDENGNNKTSDPLNINVQRSGPSVYLEKTKFDVKKNEDVSIILAVVNPIGNPPIAGQLVLKPPGAISESFACGDVIGICSTEFKMNPGDNKGVTVKVHLDKEGEYPIKAEIYYQFENGPRVTRYENIILIIEPDSPTPTPTLQTPQMPQIPPEYIDKLPPELKTYIKKLPFLNGAITLLIIILAIMFRKGMKMR